MRSLYFALGLLAAVPARADEQLLLRPAADIAIGATALGTLVATELLQDRLQSPINLSQEKKLGIFLL